MRVLVVEDNALLRHHLKVQLQELGHQVDAAEDAREADYYLGEHLPDIAIVDLGLPDEDGFITDPPLAQPRRVAAGAGADRPRRMAG